MAARPLLARRGIRKLAATLAAACAVIVAVHLLTSRHSWFDSGSEATNVNRSEEVDSIDEWVSLKNTNWEEGYEKRYSFENLALAEICAELKKRGFPISVAPSLATRKIRRFVADHSTTRREILENLEEASGARVTVESSDEVFVVGDRKIIRTGPIRIMIEPR